MGDATIECSRGQKRGQIWREPRVGGGKGKKYPTFLSSHPLISGRCHIDGAARGRVPAGAVCRGRSCGVEAVVGQGSGGW